MFYSHTRLRFFLMIALMVASVGQTVAAASVRIEKQWARVSNVDNSALFLTIINEGEMPDRLLSASTDVAQTVELHTHIRDGDIFRMRPVKTIDVAAHSETILEPGGRHIMLIDLKQALVENTTIRVALTFEKAGVITIKAPVRKKKGACCHEHIPTDETPKP